MKKGVTLLIMVFAVVFGFVSCDDSNGTARIVSDAASLKSAIADGKVTAIYLGDNIALEDTIEVTRSLTLDLNGKKISSSSETGVSAKGKNVVVTITGNGEIEAGRAVEAIDDAKVIIENGKYSGTFAVCAGRIYKDENSKITSVSDGHVVINDGDFTSTEFTVPVWGTSSAEIKGGTFTATDNAVIGTNGSQELQEDKYTITISGGTFNGGITTGGYIACGIYMANTGTVNLYGGTFDITGGVGVLVRSGKLNATGGKITLKEKDGLTSGRVGDSTVTIKTDSQIVVDDRAGYPGEAPEVVTNTASFAVKDTLGNEYVKASV